MNEKFEHSNKNFYEGNGWSKYQLMVLQQLDDHNKVLQNLNKEIIDLKQLLAVTQTEDKMWRAQTMLTLEELSKKVTHILYDEKGLGSRINSLENELDIEEQAKTRMKATWALYGAVIIFIFDAAFKMLNYFLK